LIALASSFELEPIAAAVRFWCRRRRLPATVATAPYGQLAEAVLDPGSVLRSARPGAVNALLMRPEDQLRVHEGELGRLRSEPEALAAAAARLDALASSLIATVTDDRTWVLALLPAPADVEEPLRRFGAEQRSTLARRLAGRKAIVTLDVERLPARYGVDVVHEPYGDAAAHRPFTAEYCVALGTEVARIAAARLLPPRKAIVLDCDDTLWAGACGEDGLERIRVTPGHRALQEAMLAQQAAGRLLCVASRNAEADVRRAFASLEMPLRFDDLAAHRIGWGAKSQSLRSLAAQLRLGLDSFVLVDDDPAQCEEVRTHCSEVEVVQLPREPRAFAAALDRAWCFDVASVTEEDRLRSARYRVARERSRQIAAAADPEAFLRGLEIVVEIAPLTPADHARAAQLTQRTNQFNLDARRRSEGELAAVLRTPGCEGHAVRVRDRLGDYGFVGLLVTRAAGTRLEVDTFLMSCRVLDRRVEAEMLRWLGERAIERGLETIELPLRRTERNVPAQRFVAAVGGPLLAAADVAACVERTLPRAAVGG